MERFEKPYKGTDSFQVEDGQLFYGREAEAGQLVARILSSRFTLVHAQSGAGKTSLLNARVIPELEVRGWIPVRVRLQNDPTAAARAATLQYLLPPPKSELLALTRACDALGLSASNATIADIVTRYDALPIRDRRKRELIAPMESGELAAEFPLTGVGAITPYTCRLLRASLDLQTIGEHWGVVDAAAAHTGTRPEAFSEGTSIAEIERALTAPQHREAYESLLSFLNPPGRRDLLDFFANLVSVYAPRFTRFGLVLLFDQFEELFTRFVDLGALGSKPTAELPDWRLRWEFFEQLRRLYTQDQAAPALEPVAAKEPMPIRMVISMRSEYLAQLVPLRPFVADLDKSAYHLQLLGVAEAASAIKVPASEFNYGYEQDCYDRIIDELTKEERFIEPAHLQVVCEHLWNAKGQELARQASSPELPLVTLKLYEQQNGLRGIMRAFLWDFLDSLDERARLETVELLEHLLTPTRTRNIVERDYLVQAPLRNRKQREDLLQQLVNRTIVRVETRLGGQFVEITHEFLIEPVSEAIQKILSTDSTHKRLVLALNELEYTHQAGSLGGIRATLVDWELQVLHQQRDEIEWPGWAVEVIYRNSISLKAQADVQRAWSGRLAATQYECSDRALVIIDEFLAADDIECRGRAVAALAVLEAPGAAERLTRAALCDTDAALRAQAEHALCTLAAKQPAAAGRALQTRIDDPSSGRAAYAMLGRLRMQGIKCPIALGRVRTRLARAFRLFDEVRKRGWRVWFRGCLPALWGTIFGWLLTLSIFSGLELEGTHDHAGTEVGFLLGILAAWIIVVRTTPTVLHFDRVAGVAVDIANATILMIVPALVLLILGVATYTPQIVDWVTGPLIAAFVALLAVARVVAAGTYGAVKVPFIGPLLRTLAAGFAGLIASGLVLAAAQALFRLDASGWAGLWPLAFALAAGFVVLDKPSTLEHGRFLSSWKLPGTSVPADGSGAANLPPANAVAQRHPFATLVTILAASGALLLLASAHQHGGARESARDDAVKTLRLDSASPGTSHQFQDIPVGSRLSVNLEADMNGLLQAKARIGASDRATYFLRIAPRDDSGRCMETPLLFANVVREEDLFREAPVQEVYVPKGVYCVEVEGTPPDVPRPAFDVISGRIGQRVKEIFGIAAQERGLGPVLVELSLKENQQ